MKVVTSGFKFLDIDAYGGCVAYAELLRLQGEDAVAFSSAKFNESITGTVRSWEAAFVSNYEIQNDDTFILIDVSEPEHIEKLATIERVEEVIDHHVGYEAFWKQQIGDKSDIEFIGAACTMVYERWVAAGLLHMISIISARLLICGILDNTLNFKAGVTTDRDVAAYDALLAIAGLPNDWTAQYFNDCQATIVNDVATALKYDAKSMKFRHLDLGEVVVGQMVVWDGSPVLANSRAEIESTMSALSENWFVNIVSISEGVSYFLSSNQTIERWAASLLQVTFEDGLAKADRLWLRKEMNKKDQAV